MRKGNHRRTKSTHPDELNKMMFSLAAKEAALQTGVEDAPAVIVEEIKESMQPRMKQRQLLPPGISSSFTESS
jgi:hypothetical protein